MFNTILLDTDRHGVTTLTLNRPEKHNTISGEMIDELTKAATMLRRDSSVRVVVLAGTGRTFCAGGDLNWMRDQIGASDKARREAATKLAMMLNALNTLPKPVIGALQGNTFGGGVGMACVCDVAIGITGARFGLTETRLGLIPATIGPYVIARLGEAMARRVFMSSRIFDADEAQVLGVVARVVAPDDLERAVEAEIAPYLACAPGAVAQAKALARKLGPVIDQATIARSIDALVARWQSDESEEGISAFFEKRPPDWAK